MRETVPVQVGVRSTSHSKAVEPLYVVVVGPMPETVGLFDPLGQLKFIVGAHRLGANRLGRLGNNKRTLTSKKRLSGRKAYR